VEDDDAMFRFAYPQPFLQWSLTPPHYQPSWHVGVRMLRPKSGALELVACITGVPATLECYGRQRAVCEINFLCVDKRLRDKRLAPTLIKEVTRRVNLCGVWQAVYTAGVVLPRPVASTRYWHRSIDPRKLIDVGFSRLPQRTTMARMQLH
jgi:glycylpeptide N-tetradecanoyltransferase